MFCRHDVTRYSDAFALQQFGITFWRHVLISNDADDIASQQSNATVLADDILQQNQLKCYDHSKMFDSKNYSYQLSMLNCKIVHLNFIKHQTNYSH